MAVSVKGSAGRLFLVLGAVLGFLGVAAGAFGAHGLRGRVTAELLAAYQTGARYHLIHALALILMGALAPRLSSRATAVSGWAFVIGVVVFSGSLYALALTGTRWLGAVTPFGGVSLLVGWGALVWAGWRSRASS